MTKEYRLVELNAGQRAIDACRKALDLIERCKLDADDPECIGTFEVVEEIEKLAKAAVGEGAA